MTKTKYYIAPYDDELVHTEKAIKEYMHENGLKEFEVVEAKRINDPNFFFCRD